MAKNKRQLIILSVVVVGLGAIGAMTLGPSLFHHAKKAPAKTGKTVKAGAQPDDTGAATGPKFDWMTAGPQPPVARDPFAVTIPLRLASSHGSSGPTKSSTSGPTPAWEFPPVTPWGTTPSGATPSLTTNSKPSKAPAKPVLTGTLMGDPPLALIEYGGQRLIVQRGDWIGGQYLVVSIDSGQAVLADGSEQIALTLGGGAK